MLHSMMRATPYRARQGVSPARQRSMTIGAPPWRRTPRGARESAFTR
ncbi:hypothetical protein [Cupriavidus pampae]|nr:hypothetical protein [Cupriavidus pampae]